LGEIGLAAASLGGLGVFLWAVPSLALSVPGLLLVGAVLAQAAGGLAWIPIARRKIGSFGLRGNRPRGALGQAQAGMGRPRDQA
jgi:hypothetical protein